MKLRISDIRAAHELKAEGDLDPLDIIGPPPEFVLFSKPIRTVAIAKRSEENILVNGQAETVVTLNCGRCLENYDMTLKVKFSQIYGLNREIIDLSNEIRESLLIDLPAKFLCQEDCQGLCSHCGKNKNASPCHCEVKSEDPRWNQLKKFRLK